MTTRKRSEDALRALCARVFEEDGVPVKQDRGERKRDSGRKDFALCKQVLRALNDALQGEVGDVLLRELSVRRVDPDPDASRLRVYVEPSPAAASMGATVMLEALGRANGYLRTHVARSISRKRTPTLVFCLTGERASEDPREGDDLE